jgi:hypothetical protein
VKKTLAPIFAAALTFAAPAIADPATIFGAHATCGSWTEARSRGAEGHLSDYALGYLTGAAIWSSAHNDPLSNLDQGGVTGWLDDYCKVNPLKPFNEAVADLFALRAK